MAPIKTRLESNSTGRSGIGSMSSISTGHKSSNVVNFGGKSGNITDSKNKGSSVISGCKDYNMISVGTSRDSPLNFGGNSNSAHKTDTTCDIKWKSNNPLAKNVLTNAPENFIVNKYNNSYGINGNLIKPFNPDRKFVSLPSDSRGNVNNLKLNTQSKTDFSSHVLNGGSSNDRTTDIKTNKNSFIGIGNRNNETEKINSKSFIESRSNASQVGIKIGKNPNNTNACCEKEKTNYSTYTDKKVIKTSSATNVLPSEGLHISDLNKKILSAGIIHKNTTVTGSKTTENKGNIILPSTFAVTPINKSSKSLIINTKTSVVSAAEKKDYKDIQLNSKIVSNSVDPEGKYNNLDSKSKKNKKSNSDYKDSGGKSFSSASKKSEVKEYVEQKNNAFGSPNKNEGSTVYSIEKKDSIFDEEATDKNLTNKEKNEDNTVVGAKSSSDTNEDNKYITKSNTLNSGDKSSNIPTGKSVTEEKKSGKFTSSKTYESNAYSPPKTKKHKTTFGILWIPTRKNKKKDYVYQPHNNDHYKERSPTMYPFMSGDSSENPEFKKKPEDAESLVSDRIKPPPPSSLSGIGGIGFPLDNIEETPEKQELIKQDQDESKEAAGDSYDYDDDDKKDDYLVNVEEKSPESKWEKDKLGDKVDSVYLRPKPPHKTRSTASTPEEESCGLKCLYYTLQCCDCVLM